MFASHDERKNMANLCDGFFVTRPIIYKLASIRVMNDYFL